MELGMDIEHRRRSREQFFTVPDNQKMIADIARVDSLTIFVGSGVTIDRVGFGWRELVLELLRGLDVDADEQDVLNSSYFTEPQLASIAAALYARGNASQVRLRRDVQRRIYGDFSWRQGKFSPALALLAVTLVEHGRRVSVVTTNFDQYIEIDLAKQVVAKELQGQGDANFVVQHLHGLVPVEDAERLGAPDPLESIVLSEADYFRSEVDVDGLLRNLFASDNVLVIGSGLDDAPLLRALSHTADQRATGTHRWAVLPKAGIMKQRRLRDHPGDVGISDWQGSDADNLVRAWNRRMDQFDTTLILPDYYSQAAQFLVEISVELDHVHLNQSYDSPAAKYTHTHRLTNWMNEWTDAIYESSENAPLDLGAGSREPNSAVYVSQERHHFHLSQQLSQIESLMPSPSPRAMKLEVWLRYQPGNTSRNLRLWASSIGPFRSEDTMKTVPMEDQSNDAAVQVFCSGMPQIVLTHSTHWPVFLAVPITYLDKDGPITVGSIVLGIRDHAEYLDNKETTRLSLLVAKLKEIAEPIVAVDQYPRDRSIPNSASSA
jgi:hypothetical protein